MRIADSSLHHRSPREDPRRRSRRAPRRLAACDRAPRAAHAGRALRVRPGLHTPVRDEGLRHTRARFDAVPAIVRPLVARLVRRQIGSCSGSRASCATRTRTSSSPALRDWRAVLTVMSRRTVLLRRRAHRTRCHRVRRAGDDGTDADRVADPGLPAIAAQCLAYAERMRQQYFPELVPTVAARGQD